MVTPEVFKAALEGDLAAIENWLGEGGNPNEKYHRSESDSDDSSLDDLHSHYDELASILAGARLKEYMPLLRLRSLLSRGRARHGPETTVVAARLFGSLNGFAGLPDECFWLVVKYAWLGD